MRRHPKASAVRSTLDAGSGARAGRVVATRGAFGGVDGSGAPSQRRSHFALALVLLGLALLALAPSAGAVLTRSLAQTVGADGNSPGTAFGSPASLAFNQTTKRLYALNVTSPGTLYGFDASTPGTYAPLASPFPVSLSTAPSTAVGFPQIAVDQQTAGTTAGRIYYATGQAGASTGVLHAYDSGGTLLGSPFPISPPTLKQICGVAINSTGTIFLSNANSSSSTGRRIHKYDPISGAALTPVIDTSTTGNTRPCQVAMDSNDDLYVALRPDVPASGVYRFTAASGYSQAAATEVEPDGGSAALRPVALALDTSTHVLYVVHQASVTAYDAPTATPLYTFGSLAGASYTGIAVDQSTNKVYLSDNGNKRIQVFNPPALVPNATGTPQAASNVGQTTVTLNATIDDNSGVPTKWRFQVSKDNATWANAGTGGTTAGGGVGTAVSANVTGLTHNTDYHFRVVTNKGPDPAEDVPSSSLTFHTLTIPNASVILQAATAITGTGATLNATLTDNGPLPTSWRFEISPDGTSWSAVPGGSGTTAGNQTSVPLSATATGLLPNSTYKFRLVTSKGAGSDGEIPTGALPFKTLATAPLVSGLTAIDVADTSALLVGQVDPRGSETGYVFEYGTTPALGHATEPVGIGSAQGFQLFTLPLTGLQPHTTYYYRLVATNTAGSTASAFKTLTTRVDPLPLPDERAYEMVSPPDKNGGGALSGQYAGSTIAYEGGAIAFCTTSIFGDPPPPMSNLGNACANYLSRRGDGGWATKAAAPFFCRGLSTINAQSIVFSRNLEAAAIRQPETASCPLPPFDPAAPLTGDINLYREDLLPSTPTYDLMGPAGGGEYVGSSDDFDHVVYASNANQTAPPDSPAPGSFAKLYEWDHGTLRLVSKDTAGTPLSTASAVPGENARGKGDGVNAVSASGDRIFFQNPTGGLGCTAANCELYLRQSATTTYWASQQECSPACSDTTAPDVMRYATPDGSKAFFTTAAKLTNEDTNPAGDDLYMFTQRADPATDPHNLALLSRDEEPADGTNASVLGVLGAADDGNTVYFAASNQIVLGGPTAAGPKLYRWRWNGGSPAIEYLATLGSGDGGNWSFNVGAIRRVTPSGNDLLVGTKVALDPVADSDGAADFYRWSQGDSWLCVSCQRPGAPSLGDVMGPSPGLAVNGRLAITISDDGQRVFFTTPDALVSADVNGSGGCPLLTADPLLGGGFLRCLDVYEWHDGTVSLVSPGAGSTPSRLLGISHDGTDVFFHTEDRLVGWDVDTSVDIYDARTDGGFPEPPPTGAPCDVNAGACEGAPSIAPPSAGAGSAAFEGPGNPVAKPKPHKHKKHKKHTHTKKHHQHRTAKHDRRASR